MGLMLNGQPFRFDGLNVYNANSRNNCWYWLGTGPGLGASLTAIGPGQEVFRSWFFQGEATINGAHDWTAFDHTLAVAAANRQHVIATLTDQWGNCDSSDGYKGLSWYRTGYATRADPGYQETYRQWVADVVTRYRDDPTIAMWQLVNEAEARDSLGGACHEASAAHGGRARLALEGRLAGRILILGIRDWAHGPGDTAAHEVLIRPRMPPRPSLLAGVKNASLALGLRRRALATPPRSR